MRQTGNASSRRGIGALLLALIGVSGCYVVPVTGPDGTVHYSNYPLPLPPPGIPVATASTAATLTVRLYPANEQATQTGVINGTVTNMMTGKGRFVVNYLGEVLSGEATRVSNEEKRGVASAYSPGGMYMSCEYQMNTPYQGAGTCAFANGAKYQMHIGN